MEAGGSQEPDPPREPPAQPRAAASLVTHPKRGSSDAICDAAGQAPLSQVSRWQVEQSCPSLGEWLQGHGSVPGGSSQICAGMGRRGMLHSCPGMALQQSPAAWEFTPSLLLSAQVIIYTCTGINQRAESLVPPGFWGMVSCRG